MKITTILILLNFITFGLYSQVPIDGMIAYYPFSGNATDFSGNSNHGLVTGATLTTDRFGKANSAYSFNGTTDYITIPANSIFDLTDSLTISAWVYLNIDNIGIHPILSKGDNLSNEYSLTIDKSTKLATLNKQGIETYVSSLNTIFNSKWTLITVTYKFPIAKVYINGILDNTSTMSSKIISSASNLLIGNLNPIITGNMANGKIDEVLIYNRPLSVTEIGALYEFGNNKCLFFSKENSSIQLILGNSTLPPKLSLVKLYPNPTQDILNISTSDLVSYSVKIINNTGTIVYSTILNSKAQISLKTLGSSGLYFIQLSDLSGNILETKKIILQ